MNAFSFAFGIAKLFVDINKFALSYLLEYLLVRNLHLIIATVAL